VRTAKHIMGTEQKVVVITGASQGIGAGLVKAFRDRHYRIIANSRSIKPSSDPDVLAIAGDVADAATAKQIVAEGIRRFGRIDTLINNAGIFIAKPFVDYSEADFTAMVAVNLAGFFHISQKVIPGMLGAGSGHIVTITATIAEQPTTSLPAALASLTKVGLNAVTRALAIEYAGRGIRVNAVSPGAVKTPMHTPQTHGFLATLQPMGRMGEVQEIRDAVLYLEKAAFVTGEILHVDGGASAGRW